MALSRYGNLPLIITDNDKPRLASFPTIKPKELESDTDIVIVWKDEMRIDILAHQYLGDGRYWWAICLLNGISLPFSHDLIPGSLIRIPTDISKIFNVINDKINTEF